MQKWQVDFASSNNVEFKEESISERSDEIEDTIMIKRKCRYCDSESIDKDNYCNDCGMQQ